MFRNFFVPHSFEATCLSLARTSIRADSPFGKLPAACVLLRISQSRHSRMPEDYLCDENVKSCKRLDDRLRKAFYCLFLLRISAPTSILFLVKLFIDL